LKSSDAINDVFVLSKTGLPYFSACFGGENCLSQPNHVLVSGFIAAVFQFSLQFGQKSIRNILFEDGQISVEHRNIGKEEIITVFFASNGISIKKLRKVVIRATDAFEEKFSSLFSNSTKLKNLKHFKTFSNTLLELRIVNRTSMGEVPLVNSCDHAMESSLAGYVYCKVQEKDISYEDELKFLPVSSCPYYK
jgi:hypothetical protein